MKIEEKREVGSRSLQWAVGMLLAMAGCSQQPSSGVGISSTKAEVAPTTASAPASTVDSGVAKSTSDKAVAHEDGASKEVVWGRSSSTRADHAPEDLHVYASTQAAPNTYCVAGAISEDGTDQRPYVAVSSANQGKGIIIGSVQPPLGGYAKGRATRCEAHDGELYALVEFDTQLAAQTSQTVLEVWKIDGSSLSLLKRQPLVLKKQGKAYSFWMPEDDSQFGWTGGELKISGKYFPLSNRDEIKKFELSVDTDLVTHTDQE